MVGQVGQLPHQYFGVTVNDDVIMTSLSLHSAPPILSSRLPPWSKDRQNERDWFLYAKSDDPKYSLKHHKSRCNFSKKNFSKEQAGFSFLWVWVGGRKSNILGFAAR